MEDVFENYISLFIHNIKGSHLQKDVELYYTRHTNDLKVCIDDLSRINYVQKFTHIEMVKIKNDRYFINILQTTHINICTFIDKADKFFYCPFFLYLDRDMEEKFKDK